MRINHNIASMVTQGSLSRVNRDMGKSLQKLSTGLRINSAADDAAGLGVSENLRTQVRGLGQALKNTQDTISMLNIADGALQEQADIMQRMRELVIQAKNDTYTSTEREYMYQEFNGLMHELDRIAAATNYNGMQLFATPHQAGLDSSGGEAQRVYTAQHPNGISGNGLEAPHAVRDSNDIWGGGDSLFGADDYSSAHHFNMMIGADYSQADIAARNSTLNSYGEGGAENMMTIQFGQMDVHALLTPYPPAGTGQMMQGDAYELWDSFDYNPRSAFGVNDGDMEDYLIDAWGPKDPAGTFGDFTVQDKLNFLLKMIDGDAKDINSSTINFGFAGTTNVTGLDRINRMRGAIGAWTNRLEHAANNMTTQITNQQAAESQIRDVDFAAEAAKQTRSSILAQSATAMLSQANMSQQSVLQLLG